MGKRVSKSASKHEGEFEVEGQQAPELEGDLPAAEMPGLPSKEKAKELAKEKSKKPKTPEHVLYTMKGTKVLKLICKPGKVYTVYVGNMGKEKQKAALAALVKGWKAEGAWIDWTDDGQQKLKQKLAALGPAQPPRKAKQVAK